MLKYTLYWRYMMNWGTHYSNQNTSSAGTCKLMNITIQTNCEGLHHTSEEVQQEVSTASVNYILLRAHSRSMHLEQ